MALVNEYYLRLPGSYLFADVAKRVTAFKVSHPKQRVISLGIGDPPLGACRGGGHEEGLRRDGPHRHLPRLRP